MNIYCPSCGRANPVVGVSPLFCGFCKSSLGVSSDSIQPPRQTVARRPDQPRRRRPEPEPEPVYEDDDQYYDDEPQPRRQSLSHIKLSFVDEDVKEKKEPERTPVRMDQVFAGGSLGAANNGPIARPEELKDKSYTGGDKKTFARNFLNDSVFTSAKGKPVQEVG